MTLKLWYQVVYPREDQRENRRTVAPDLPEIGWTMLPDALVQAGTAGVTALIHEVRNFGASCRFLDAITG